MLGVRPHDPESPQFVEVDPTGRYGRYHEILGKGASKIVYRGFDEYEGIEVAWNQVKLNDFLQSPDDLERLYCEIHLLKTLKHKNIMKFYTSWVDTSRRNINFITEMFTSGTLRQYRQKHRRVNIRALKHWCRQILKGLLYLHSHDPPIIHRDLKCDNIFINGHQGEVKIGDLGLAAILRKSDKVHCVGTPEFMAPEVYDEEYNELVDIYSFGMCILEMVTLEYPYSECTHPVQIYKKVTSGTKPEALYRVNDPEVKKFVEKCLATASKRLSAKELLGDSFLRIDGPALDLIGGDAGDTIVPRQPYYHEHSTNGSLITTILPEELQNEEDFECEWGYNDAEIETHGINLFNNHEDEEPLANVDIMIRGKRREDGVIFLRLRITDSEGHVRNVYFPFDIEADTALSVATEMVAELDITDHDVTRIAEMIDGEVSSLVPEWKPRPASISGYTHVQAFHGLQSAAMHGRFEEVTYQVSGSEPCIIEDGLTLSSHVSMGRHSDDEGGMLEVSGDHESSTHISAYIHPGSKEPTANLCSNPLQGLDCPVSITPSDYEISISQQSRYSKPKYQMEQHDLSKPHEGSEDLHVSPDFGHKDHTVEKEIHGPSIPTSKESFNNIKLKSVHQLRNFSFRIDETFESPNGMGGYPWSSSRPGLGTQKA